MTFSAGSNSSPASIPPTSRTSWTPSSTPNPNTNPQSTESVHVEISLEGPQAQPNRFDPIDLLPSLPGVLVSLVAVYAVHKLTKSREREKAVFDLYRTLEEHASKTTTAAIAGWSTRAGPERRRAIAETKWRLQQLGATVERMRILSVRRRWRFGWSFRPKVSVSATGEMATLRRRLTADPFEDPRRRVDHAKAEYVEQEVGAFVEAVDQKLFEWIR